MKKNKTYSVGFNSGGKYKTRAGSKIAPAYQLWRNMLRRCYDTECQERFPTYKGCSVSENWFDYQVFADWFYSHKYSNLGFHLDKDILVSNNKVYSPDACCFVPSELNNLFTDSAASRGKFPQGVYLNKRSNKYMARLTVDGKSDYLGLFDCCDKAHQVYISAKESRVKKLAQEWRGRIDERVYEALMHWKVTE